jgi:nucleoside recognition membrane protein YjiH
MAEPKRLRSASMWKDGKGVLLIATTVAAFVFVIRFWFLFLPVNVLSKLSFLWQWLSRLRPHRLPSSTFFIPIIFLLLLFSLTVTTGICTYLFYRLARVFWKRSWPIVIVFMIVCLTLGWLLWPTACDTHESFTDIPNRICDCSGFTFAFYPPWVLADGTSTDYCVGWERPAQP